MDIFSTKKTTKKKFEKTDQPILYLRYNSICLGLTLLAMIFVMKDKP